MLMNEFDEPLTGLDLASTLHLHVRKSCQHFVKSALSLLQNIITNSCPSHQQPHAVVIVLQGTQNKYMICFAYHPS